MSWMSGKWVPVPTRLAQMKPMAASPACTMSCSAQVACTPTILSRGKPTWAASFRAVQVMTPLRAQDDPVGLGHLDPQPGRLLVEPRRLHGQVLHRKAVLGGLGVEDGKGFPAKVVIDVDMGDFPALELVHAAGPLADEPDLGRVLTPPGDRGVEDIRKHPPIRGVRAPNAHREQGDLVVRGPLQQGIDERGVDQRKHRRPRRPLGFQALVALDAAGGVVDGFALFPDQGHAVDAAIALVEEGHIVDEAIGQRDLQRPRGPLAHAEHGEKLFAPPPPPSRPPAPRARRPRARSTTGASGASLCSPLPVVSSRSRPRRAGAADLPSDRHVENGQILRTALRLWHRTRRQARLKAGATQERTVEAVACTPWFGGLSPPRSHATAGRSKADRFSTPASFALHWKARGIAQCHHIIPDESRYSALPGLAVPQTRRLNAPCLGWVRATAIHPSVCHDPRRSNR